MQELFQARDIMVHCGGAEMGWKELISDEFGRQNHFDGISLRALLNVPESAQLGYSIIGKIRELDCN